MALTTSNPTLALAAPPPVPWVRPEKVAVVLNGRARGVNEGLIRELRQALTGSGHTGSTLQASETLQGSESLFVSTSLQQAEFIARHVVNGGYDVVFCGGGDGTFGRLVSDVLALRPRRMPAFGVLRLGTGNALADALGATARGAQGMAAELRGPLQRVRLPLLRTEGRLTPFAGMGLDALILQDYNAVKNSLARTPFRSLSSGPVAYGLAVATRSLWRYIGQPLPRIMIRNEGAPAQPIDLDGDVVGPAIPRGGIIYRGPASIAAVSTIPFYGFGLRMFPQADRWSDRFQLRVGRVGAANMIARLPAVFDGSFTSGQLWDFACTAISMHAEQPTATQVSGDLVGQRLRLVVGMQWVDAVATAGSAAPPWEPQSDDLWSATA